MTPQSHDMEPVSNGPIDREPRGFATGKDSLAALLQELEAAGVHLGTHDRRIAEWLANWEWSTVATIASWIKRAADNR
jgi:hypothetical protein